LGRPCLRSRGPLQQRHWWLSSGLRAEFAVERDAEDTMELNMRMMEEDIDVHTNCDSSIRFRRFWLLGAPFMAGGLYVNLSYSPFPVWESMLYRFSISTEQSDIPDCKPTSNSLPVALH